jgi:hypothetical protein
MPGIINGARIDAENNTLKQHGSLPEYKLDEIRRMNEDYKTIFLVVFLILLLNGSIVIMQRPC